MQLSTPVTIAPQGVTLDHGTRLLTVGSCFADEMGVRLQRSGFDVLANPFGTLYNPLSIAANLQMALDDKPMPEELLVQHDGLWHSWMHHSRFSSPDRAECLSRCDASIHETHRRLMEKPLWLIVTFGTAWVYYHEGHVVANCHKLPANQFERHRLTVDGIVAAWQPLIDTFQALGIQTFFTVSPIRHLADGAHGNQLSKSTLLLAVDQLLTLNSQLSTLHYFPSYEILLDELRDYRFYARDLCHPSDLAADIIYERFQQACMSPATRQQCLLNEKQHRQSSHRPIIPTNTTDYEQ